MNILVIKQTSLGDVLHASGHIRSIKAQFPNSRLTLLTAVTSRDIYQYSPWVDELVLIDRYGIKRDWWRRPLWTIGEIARTLSAVRKQRFDLALDLQGLAKSALFLYGSKAKRKIIKGNWLGLEGFRDRNLHAIRELDRVLELAGIAVTDSSMEFPTSEKESVFIDALLKEVNPEDRPLLIVSPYSRWPSKDWPLKCYLAVCNAVADRYRIVVTGTADRKKEIDQGLEQSRCGFATNLAGELSLLQFAELCSRGTAMLTGDSFPMHVAGARGLPVVALFGPTDEKKIGPLGERDKVVRVPGCDVCYNRQCPRKCLDRLDEETVIQALASL